MKTRSNQIVTDSEKEILQKIAAAYPAGYQQALLDHPEWKEVLSHLKPHIMTYWVMKFRKQVSPSRRKTSQALARLEPRLENSLPAPVNDGLNFCPCCGVNLANVRNTLVLQKSGKI